MAGPVGERWSFRVPVVRPGSVQAVYGLALALAAGSALTAASWHGPAALAGAALALLLGLGGLLHSARSGPSPVSALRTAAGAGHWQLRLPQGWRDASLLDRRRGPRWLTLTLQPLPTGSTAFTPSTITLTVWQRTLRPESWRRLCLLTGTARRTPPAAGPQEAS